MIKHIIELKLYIEMPLSRFCAHYRLYIVYSIGDFWSFYEFLKDQQFRKKLVSNNVSKECKIIELHASNPDHLTVVKVSIFKNSFTTSVLMNLTTTLCTSRY